MYFHIYYINNILLKEKIIIYTVTLLHLYEHTFLNKILLILMLENKNNGVFKSR